MKYFQWYGLDMYGKEHKGYTYGTSPAHIRSVLGEQNIAALSIQRRVDFSFFFKKSSRAAEIALFWHHLATLLSGGISLSSALQLVAAQLSLYFRAVVQDVKRHIDQGESFYRALAAHSDYFSETVIALIKASEHSGNLAQMSASIAVYYENSTAYRQKVQGALFMPLLTLLFSFFVIMGVFVSVVPQFEFFFQQQDYSLMWTTTSIFTISSFFRSSGAFFALCVIGSLIGCTCLVARTSERMKMAIDRLYARLPGVKLYSTLCFMQAFHVLVRSGVPLIDALTFSRSVVKNSYFRRQCESVCARIQEGLPLSKALQMIDNPFFPPHVVAMISVAEQSGTLTVMLEKISKLVAQDLMIVLNRMVYYIQPCVLCIVGLIVVGIILALYIPLFSMMDVVTVSP